MKCKLDCPSIMQTNRKPYSPCPQLSCINVLKLEGGEKKLKKCICIDIVHQNQIIMLCL